MPHQRYYETAGITVQVESELPFTDATLDEKFASFRVEGPGPDTVVVRHHFGLPGEAALAAALEGGEEVYRHPPWAISRTPGAWVYLGIAPQADDPTLHRVAVFNEDHTQGELYNPDSSREWWRTHRASCGSSSDSTTLNQWRSLPMSEVQWHPAI